MSRQAQEAGRLADELHAKLIAENNPENTVNAALTDPKASQAPEYPGAGTQEHQDENWEQKYKVIEGKYRTEVPALHQEHRRLMQVVQGHERTIGDLKEQLTRANAELATRQGQQQTASGDERLQQIAEDYGSDIASVIRDLQTKVAALETENQQLKSQGTQVQQNAQAPAPQPAPAVDPMLKSRINFVADLVGGEAELNRIDNDPQFNLWLSGQDHPAYPESRRENLQRLFVSGKLKEAADYYITWREQSGNGGAKATDLLGEHEQPGVNRGSLTGADGKSGRVWRMSEIRILQKQFSIDRAYRSPEGRQKAAALETEFIAAGREGRIIND